MKITRRPPPLTFGASNDDALAAPAKGAGARTPAKEPRKAASAASADNQPLKPTSSAGHVAAERRPSDALRGGPPSAGLIYLAAFAVAVLWALGPIAFAVGYRQHTAPLQNDHFAMLVFALLAIGPAALVFGAAWFIRQGQTLAAEVRRTRELEQTLLTPALRAAAEAGEVTRAVREEIAAAAVAADAARESLTSLRLALSSQTDGLVQATHASLGAAQQLSGELGRERGELQALAQALDSQAARSAEIIDQQAQKVAGVSRVAETQLRDAEQILAARAAGLAAAADEASAVARTTGEDLARHVARLETAGVGLGEQVRAVENSLSEQRGALLGLAQALRGEHEGFAAAADEHIARLDAFMGHAREAANEMSSRAADAGESLRALVAEAGDRFAALASTARLERQALGETAAGSLEAIGRAAVDQRARIETEHRQAIEALARAADDTRQAAARHAAAAREQVDQLSEAAFAAGQKANQVFEARLEEAKALVEQSARMVDEAGVAAARRLDEGASAARATLGELTAMMAALEVRARELPADARAQAETVRTAVAEGMDALLAHARRTAEEAHAIDAAFQERVRRNFEMLSEAVRLMGTAAGGSSALQGAAAGFPLQGAAAPALQAPSVEEAAPSAFVQAYAPPTVHPLPPEPAKAAAPGPAKAAGPAAPEPTPSSGSALAERLGLRPRLKLTPTQSDEEFSAIFETGRAAKPAAPAAVADDEAEEDEPAETWTWKDLLASLGGAEGGGQDADEGLLSVELGKMGVEPEKLLPEPRIEQIAAAMQTGDIDGARQVVKKLAGASSRRIVRRLFTDEDLKVRATGFVRRYQALVDDAAVRDPEGFLMTEILGARAGRVFLLLDQALGDSA